MHIGWWNGIGYFIIAQDNTPLKPWKNWTTVDCRNDKHTKCHLVFWGNISIKPTNIGWTISKYNCSSHSNNLTFLFVIVEEWGLKLPGVAKMNKTGDLSDIYRFHCIRVGVIDNIVVKCELVWMLVITAALTLHPRLISFGCCLEGGKWTGQDNRVHVGPISSRSGILTGPPQRMVSIHLTEPVCYWPI